MTLEVILGEYDVSVDPDEGYDQVIKRRIKKVTVHERYDKTNYLAGDNIALITLDESVPEDSKIVPVCLPWSETNSFQYLLNDDYLVEDNKFTFTGWGKRENDLFQSRKISDKGQTYHSFSDMPYKINLQFIPNDFCFDWKNILTSDQFCVSGEERGESVCEGDFGGPLIYHGIPKNGESINSLLIILTQ